MRTPAATLPDLIAATAERQHGVVTRTQLLTCGASTDQISRWLRDGRLRRLHAGVYAPGHAALRPEARWLAAALATSGGVTVVGAASALAVWRLGPDPRGAVHVVTTGSARGRDGIVVQRTRRLDVADRTVVRGVPVTAVPRTLIDVAGVVTPKQLAEAVERLQVLDLPALGRALDRAPGRRGTAPLRLLVTLQGPHLRSILERAFFALCRAHRLPLPETNVRVEGKRVDFLWRERALVVETDGWRFHGGRAAFAADRRRDIRLQIAGWRVGRFTYERVVLDPGGVAADVWELLGGGVAQVAEGSSSPLDRP
jgi:very-short-patch-repair endonuclease